MKTFKYTSSLWLPHPLEEVFNFFSDPMNLEEITPDWLHFQIMDPVPQSIEVGSCINYKLRFRGFPLRWTSVITTWEPPNRFIDSQIKGPYRKWVHEHTFHEIDGGTLAKDHVEYATWGDSLVNTLLVGPDVQRIFKYRATKLRSLFPSS